MKVVNLAFIIIMLVCGGFAQPAKTNPPGFDAADFTKKLETVEWLLEYDNVAWQTTDV